jgi:hypothetical protein
MELLTTLVDKSLFVVFFMSCLIVLRQIFLFSRHLRNPEPQKYTISTTNLIYLGLSIAVIITAIIKGIGL